MKGNAVIMKEYKKFDSPQHVCNWITKVYSQQTLDSFDLNKQSFCSPLTYYAGSMADLINSALRRGIQEHPVYHYECLQSNLLRQQLPDNIITYRFVSIKELLYLWFKTMFNKSYENPGFISTTLLPQYYTGQAKGGRIRITIYAQQGSHGMYITELKNAITEYEILFAHHTYMARKGLLKFELLSKSVL